MTSVAAEIAALDARVRALETPRRSAASRRATPSWWTRAMARRPATARGARTARREIAALFAQDTVWDGGAGLGLCEGRAAIRARMAEPTLLFSRHYFVNPQIDLDGDWARVRWELLAPCTMRDARPAWMRAPRTQ